MSAHDCAPQPCGACHLRTRTQFQAVMAAGTLVRTPHFALHWLAPGPHALWPQPEMLWLGPLVPKRWARRSVTRHAVRRQIYALGGAAPLPAGGCVVRLRSTFSRKVFVSASSDALKRAVRAELQQLFAAACQKLNAPDARA